MELQYFFKDTVINTYTDIDNNLWFIGKEIARILGYKDANQAIRKNVDEEDRLEFGILIGTVDETPPCNENDLKRICINESGLYSLILKSKMEEAKIFKRWVTNEVLPSIRQQGEYKVKQDIKEQLSLEFEKKLLLVETKAAEEYKLRIKRDKQLEREKEEKRLLHEHLCKYETLQKDDVVYVQKNIFKVGKTTKQNLKSRLCNYNTGRKLLRIFTRMH